MPTYDYLCQECGHRFEQFQSMSDEPLTACPVCSGSVKRLITGGTGLIFKGSGFYITDYQNTKKSEEKQNGAAPKTETPGKSGESSGASSATDSSSTSDD